MRLNENQHDFRRFRLGIYRTSRPVWNSGKFSKSGLSGNWRFSFLKAGLLKIGKES
jgi:hypothetical protein